MNIAKLMGRLRIERFDHAQIWSLGAMLLFACYFAAWWIHLKPGVFSYDSGYYLSEVVSGNIADRKPFLYARFLELTSFGGRAFQVSVFVQVMLIVLMLSRLAHIAIKARTPWYLIAICLFVAINPYVANMAFYLQNDILFCFAMIAICAETLWVARQGRISSTGLLLIALASPMVFAFRENGILFLPIWLGMLPLLVKREVWIRIAAASLTTTVLAYSSIIGVDREDRHDVIYPAVIHEAVRLSEPGYRYEHGRLSEQTQVAIGKERLSSATPLYWPLYWDTIAFFPGGPNLASLPLEQRKSIVHSFMRHDLLPNLPSIIAHRLEVLLGAAFAQGEPIDPYGTPANLPASIKGWKERSGSSNRGVGVLGKLNAFWLQYRMWTWSAIWGLAILCILSIIALRRHDRPLLLISILLWFQAIAVAGFAPSAEFRYVFMLYLVPLLLATQNRQGRTAEVQSLHGKRHTSL